MRNLIKSSIFIVGFLCGLPIFLFSTLAIERHYTTVICFDCQMRTGFPFSYYQDSGFVVPSKILWLGLIADILIGVIFSVVVGLIFKFIWENLTKKKIAKLFQSTIFIVGFCISGMLFNALNYLSYFSHANMFSCDDCIIRLGFPFYFYERGGFFTVNQFIWSGLIADVLIAVIFSFVIGLIFKFVWEKIAAKRLR